jgi:hypothetical protein
LDTLTNLLLKVANDLVLDPEAGAVKTRSGVPQLHGIAAFQKHPLHSAIVAEAQNDPDLKRLFPDINHPSGRARPYRPGALDFQLVNAAAWHNCFTGDTSRQGYEARLANLVDQLRRACRTGREQARILIGLKFSLPPGTEIELPWGVLRADRPSDAVLYAYTGPHENGLPEARCLLEIPTELPVTITPTGSFNAEEMPSFDDERGKLVSLAAFLTLGPENFRPTLPWLVTRISDLAPGLPGCGTKRRSIEGPAIPANAVEELREWIELLAVHRIPQIALDRSLSIMATEQSYIYCFIDAVIAWENLFGTGDTQELGYRVSMNMAAVMGDTVEERVTLQREVRRLYSDRSRIVHGGYQPSPAEAHKLLDDARRHTFTAISRLIRRYPHLIGAKSENFVAFLLGQVG